MQPGNPTKVVERGGGHTYQGVGWGQVVGGDFNSVSVQTYSPKLSSEYYTRIILKFYREICDQVKCGRRRKSWTKVICFPLLCNKRCLSWVKKIMSLKQLRSRVQSCFPSTVVSVWLCIQLYNNIFCIIISYHHLKNVYKGKYFATQHIILFYMHMHATTFLTNPSFCPWGKAI